MNTRFLFIVLSLMAVFSQPVHASNNAAERGKARAQAQCAACHAKNGDWNQPLDASYPKLSGQHKDYLTQALQQYRDGRRKNAIMAAQAKGLSDQDIDELSSFFGSLKGDLYIKK
ncbi:MAG: c-type cytochrome [Burkholderiaceae bacterium]|jgi:cytochrome c553